MKRHWMENIKWLATASTTLYRCMTMMPKKSLLIKLDHAKDTVAGQDAERDTLVDGYEPPERRGLVRQ